ncbi:MAG: cadherin-like domain-containing protein [Methylococcaceae bacterium]|nr:cadherin-like domain-containing protein [Methylococcaceae bacterium]
MTTTKEIVFIDRNVSDIDLLISNLRHDVEPVIVSPTRSAVAQIVEAVAGRYLKVIHLLAHGQPGEINFGAETLAIENIGDFQEEMSAIGRALGKNGSLQLWSCETAKGECGKAFVEALSASCGVPVVASTEKVGAGILGGNWELNVNSEFASGKVPLTVQGMEVYKGVMAIVNATAGEDLFDGLGNGTTAGDDTIIYTAGNQVDNTLADPGSGIVRSQDSIDGGAGFDIVQIGVAGNGVTIDLGKASLVAPVAPPALFFNIEGLSFGNTAGTGTAKMLAEQFGPGLFTNNLAVTGVAGSNQAINITFLDAAGTGGSFDASLWTFTNWTSVTDIIDIQGSLENDVITGSIMADIIDGNSGDDIIRLANGYFAAGESINGGTNVIPATDADKLLLTNATIVDFNTGILTNIELIAGSAGNDQLTMSFSQWGGITTSIDLGTGVNILNVTASLVGTLGGGAVGIPAAITNVTTGNLVGTAAGGNDTITLSGAQLNAILIGAGTVNLGAGTDTLTLSSTSADLNALGAIDASISGVERIAVAPAGGAAAGVNISLTGQTEAFTISGGSGADTIVAGLGNDTINLASGDFVAGESLDGGAGSDTIALISNVTVDLSVGSITRIENLTGSAASDTVSMSASQWNNFAAIDLIGATNTLNVIANGDITAAATPTLANISTGNLRGTTSNDTVALNGAQLNSIIIGGGNIDLGQGSDTINLTSTSSDLNGLGAVNNNITGVEAISASTATNGVTISLTGQSEGFTVTGGLGADNLTGGTGADSINGGIGNDVLIGGAGTDSINGGSGNDTVTGGTDADTLSGGSHGDLFNFAAGDSALTVGAGGGGGGGGGTSIGSVSGYDVITDFTAGSVAGISDVIGYANASLATNGTVTTNINSKLELNTTTKAVPVVIASHNIVNGIISFDDTEIFSTAFPLTTAGDVAAAVDYLQRNTIGPVGASVAFTATIAGGGIHTYIFIEGGLSDNDDLIDLPNVVAASITASGGQINVHVTPVANPDILAATEDNSVTYTAADLLGNDSNSIGIASVANGVGGTVVLNSDGTITFTPTANFNGTANFTYIATEGLINSNSTGVTVNVQAVNDAPAATPVVLTAIAEDSGSHIITAAQLLAGVTDVDGPAPTITALTLAAGSKGTLINTGVGTWSYTPALNDSASAIFNYTTSDGALTASSTASLDITPVNDAPVATPVVLSAIAEDSGARIITAAQLLAGVTDVDGPTPRITSLTLAAGSNGKLINTGGGTWSYTPALNDNSSAIFNYTASDGTLTTSSTASLDITPVNDAPVANNDLLTAITGLSTTFTAAQLLGNDTDVDNAILTIASVTSGIGGTVVRNPDGTVTFTSAAGFTGAASFSYIASDGTLNSNSANVTINVTTVLGGLIISGNDGPDILLGTTKGDILLGLGGNDTLNGGAGVDRMEGGLGNDTFVVGEVGDVVVENLASGSDIVRTTLTNYTLGDNIENLKFTGTAAFTGTGNELSNTITGGVGVDTLIGLGGNDTLVGAAGADIYQGGLGNDTYVVDIGDTVIENLLEGTDTIKTSLVNYTLDANVENLTYTGLTSFTGTGNTLANIITGGALNDSLNGGDGADTLSGLTGTNIMTGGAGNDIYVVGSATDATIEIAGGGTDTVKTNLASYTLGSEVEILTYTGILAFSGTGNGSANFLVAGAGNQILDGGAGNDRVSAGVGNDTLIGGSGSDVFRFDTALNATTNLDTVSDFVHGVDKIQLENSIFLGLTATGLLQAANFRASINGAAGDANDFVLYETDSGALFYDADGTGAGAAVQIATLIGLPPVTSSDFTIT